MAILLREYLELRYDKSVVKEAREKKLPIQVPALLQRADAVNQNKRIYPRSILEREVENYKKAIAEGRATGELDHPDCVRKSAKILTKNGWKDFKDISDSEYVYTLNTKNNQVELQHINKKIEQEYSGELFLFSGRNINTAVTPRHRFWLIDRCGKGSFVSAEEIYQNRKKYNKHYIPKIGSWDVPEDKKIFTLNAYLDGDDRVPSEYRKSIDISMDVWSSFLGLYLSEGHSLNREIQKGFMVKITQKHEEKKQKIRELLAKFPKEIEWKERDYGDGKVDFFVNDARLHSYLSPLGKSHEKYIPFEMKQLSSGYLQNILDWFVLGDGRIRVCNEHDEATEVFSTSRKLIEDLNEILFKCGGSGNVYVRKPYDREIEGRLIKEENQKDLYFLHFSTTQGIYLDERFLSIEKISYSDKVYCVSVPNETFYCMDGGKTYWSGNSSIVSLERVSHIVRDLWWNGNDVYGTVEVLNTPKGKIAQDLMEAGVRLGISSRGVGETVKTNEGYDMVDESFMLVAFDLVSEPSTQNAWLGLREGREISVDTIRQMVPKVDRINRILNEILR